MYKRILVPMDGSEASKHALKAAMESASKWDAELVLLTVIPPVSALLRARIQVILKHTEQFHTLLGNYTEKDVAKYQKEVADSLGKFRKYLMKKRNLGIYVDYDEETYEFTSPFDVKQKDIDELMEITILPVQVMKMMIDNELTTKIWDIREKY